MTKAPYAQGTSVPSSRSRDELERFLRAHGATGFATGWDDEVAHYSVMFRIADRTVRLTVPRPDPADFRRTPAGRSRTNAATKEAAEQEERRRWRALLLITKARLVSVADGVMTIEEAFLNDVVLPDGSTVGEWVRPQLDVAYSTAQMPALIPGARPRAIGARA